jgi:hypothetical protein
MARIDAELREVTFAHYGQACACCGTTENLTIDHINGSGDKHRQELFGHWKNRTAGVHFYRWLRDEGWPKGYQTLCLPCNNSKSTGERCRIHSMTGTK